MRWWRRMRSDVAESPCVRVCEIDNDVCRGCHRTLNEIALWGSMSDAERHAVLSRIDHMKQYWKE